MQRYWIYGGIAAGALIIVLLLWWVLRKDLSEQIVIPYISHQAPLLDPHLPHSVALSDKLDELVFDGLFNVAATPSGIVYEDGLGELIDISEEDVVTIRLKRNEKWHTSYRVVVDDDDVEVSEAESVYFLAEDLAFTLDRIRQLGSLAPDYILVSQALQSFDFEGPDNNNEIRLRFKHDRIWTEADIKEVLSFKIIPRSADRSARRFQIGSGPYLSTTPESETSHFYRNPARRAEIPHVRLAPFIDNSTFTTELKNGNINVLLDTPFGAQSPILQETEEFFVKSNISTTMFALLFNTQRLDREQRKALRALIDNRVLLERFYKVGTPQQRHIVDYKGNSDNYGDYLNHSVFPSTSYYVEEEIVLPPDPPASPDYSILPDSIRVVATLNYGHREEYREMVEILNDRTLFGGRIRAYDVQNAEIKAGNYDALLIAFNGYKSNFFFNLYDIFLREPDFDLYKINLSTTTNSRGEQVAAPQSLQAAHNFCRLDATSASPDLEDITTFLEYMHGFMYTNQVGDRQIYAERLAQIEHDLALGKWLFSLPSLAYFSTQFEEQSIDLYGQASQLSTIEKWQERRED